MSDSIVKSSLDIVPGMTAEVYKNDGYIIYKLRMEKKSL